MPNNSITMNLIMLQGLSIMITLIEISALKEPAQPAINNSDSVAAIHSFKVVKATGKNKKSTASECIMAQYKKKGMCDYKLLNNHTRIK